MSGDIYEELCDWAAIVDGAKNRAMVVMLSGVVFSDAAQEIHDLRKWCDALAFAAGCQCADAISMDGHVSMIRCVPCEWKKSRVSEE